MLGLGGKEWDFVPAKAFGGFADGGQVLVALLLGGLETQGEGA